MGNGEPLDILKQEDARWEILAVMWTKGPERHITAGNQHWCSGIRREVLPPTLRDVAVEAENSGQTVKIEEPVTDLVNAWAHGSGG